MRRGQVKSKERGIFGVTSRLALGENLNAGLVTELFLGPEVDVTNAKVW